MNYYDLSAFGGRRSSSLSPFDRRRRRRRHDPPAAFPPHAVRRHLPPPRPNDPAHVPAHRLPALLRVHARVHALVVRLRRRLAKPPRARLRRRRRLRLPPRPLVALAHLLERAQHRVRDDRALGAAQILRRPRRRRGALARASVFDAAPFPRRRRRQPLVPGLDVHAVRVSAGARRDDARHRGALRFVVELLEVRRDGRRDDVERAVADRRAVRVERRGG
eukprot:31566-Pelagococcus_subviridis.AAC.15